MNDTRARIVVTITPTAWDDPDGEALRRAQRTELDARYGNDDHEPGGAPIADEISVFLVARDPDGTACGCGALRQLDATSAEIKRMYVVPTHRGRGVSTAILRALEDHARTSGWPTLRLETGLLQPDAIRFYEREGYRRIPNFGKYVGVSDSVCYEKTLA